MGLTDRLGELVHTASYAARAAELGSAISAENGLAEGVRVLERVVDEGAGAA